jgi:hypothetical protein
MSKIINILPLIDHEGYFDNNINIEHSLNLSLLEKIVRLKPDNNFSQEDEEILNKIKKNHKNLIKKKIILNKFMINKREINELKSISKIWISEEYNDLIQKHLDQKRNTLEPCVRCLN